MSIFLPSLIIKLSDNTEPQFVQISSPRLMSVSISVLLQLIHFFILLYLIKITFHDLLFISEMKNVNFPLLRTYFFEFNVDVGSRPAFFCLQLSAIKFMIFFNDNGSS